MGKAVSQKNKKKIHLADFSGIILGVLAVIILSIANPKFISGTNLGNLGQQASINVLLSLGMLLVIVTGGIDLSVGTIAGFAGVLVAGYITQGMPVFWAIMLVLLIGAFLGAFSGVMVVYGGVAPFIATLCMQTIARGFTLLYTHSRSIFVSDETFLWIGNAAVFGIPIPIIIMVVLTIFLQFVMRKTTYGRSLYAYGGNPNASYLAGINTNLVVLKAYIYSAIFASFAGIVLASRMAVGSPLVGPGMEGNAIAAVVIGGASLAGGTGNAINTLIGALIIGSISNALNLFGMQSYLQKVVIGFITLGAVLIRSLPEKLKKN